MDMTKLKPCPFCGCKLIHEMGLSKFHYYMLCDNCRTTSGNYETIEQAIEAWNRRTNATK